jgi:hypothetical protein
LVQTYLGFFYAIPRYFSEQAKRICTPPAHSQGNSNIWHLSPHPELPGTAARNGQASRPGEKFQRVIATDASAIKSLTLFSKEVEYRVEPAERPPSAGAGT